MRGLRVYAENNEMLRKYVSDAYAGLEALLEEIPEITLAVREDRFLYEKDTVHINSDREEGLPFLFYRNAFRRITFVRGMSEEELTGLMKAVATDCGGYEYAGEDLVTLLWRLALPHFRYLTIDALTIEASNAKTSEERDDLERIQVDIEGIVARIYQTGASEEELVKGLSITKEDLEALRSVREDSIEELDLDDRVTHRAITNIPEEELERIKTELDGEIREDLLRRMMEILVKIAFVEQSAGEASHTIGLLQQLFDTMVLSHRYVYARDLLELLKQTVEHDEDLKRMHIARHLLKMFASESRVAPVLSAFNDSRRASSINDMVEFLRSLGFTIAPILLSSLETLNSPAHRRLICDLIVEFGVPEPAALLERMITAKWFVIRDILTIAQHHPPEDISALVKRALDHKHPKIRAHAVGLLRGYKKGIADSFLATHINDEDAEVRLMAIRVSAARRSAEAMAGIEEILSSKDFGERSERELKLLMMAYASIAGPKGVTALDQILNPGFFAALKIPEAQTAAAFALATIGTEAAVMALQKGSRTLNPKVRDACKRALQQDSRRKQSRRPKTKQSTVDLDLEADNDSNQITKDLEDGASFDTSIIAKKKLAEREPTELVRHGPRSMTHRKSDDLERIALPPNFPSRSNPPLGVGIDLGPQASSPLSSAALPKPLSGSALSELPAEEPESSKGAPPWLEGLLDDSDSAV